MGQRGCWANHRLHLQQQVGRSLNVTLPYSERSSLRFLALFCLLLPGCTKSENDSEQVLPVSREESAPFFVAVNDEVGLKFVHAPGDLDQFEMPQIMAAGGAWADFDADGSADLLFTNGGHQSEPRLPVFLRAQQSRFADESIDAGIQVPMAGSGAAVGDLDNDGFLDCLLTGVGESQLWMNNGDGTFRLTRPVSMPRTWSCSAAFGPLRNDGLLDIVIVNYLAYKAGDYCEDNGGAQEFCGPSSFPGVADLVLRNEGRMDVHGTPELTDVTVESGVRSSNGKGLGVVIADVTGDGRSDIYVTNDMVANHCWVQQEDGAFVDEAVLRGVAFNWLGEAEASMGIVTGDLTGRGRTELFLTHLRGQTHTLYSRHENGAFLDETIAAGFAEASLPSTGFGVIAEDFNHDGKPEILIANGAVKRPAAEAVGEPGDPISYAEPNQFLTQDASGRFSDYHSTEDDFLQARDVSRGVITSDMDDDGDQDLLVINCAGPARVYRNIAPKIGHWLQIRLSDPAGNRFALGATISITCGAAKYSRQITTGGGYQTSHDSVAHFGIHEDEIGEIVVDWPDGASESFGTCDVDHRVILRRGRGSLRDVR